MKETTSTRLQRILSERGLKQVDVLERAAPYCKGYGIKLNKSDLSQYVSGKVEPGQDKLTVLGLALNVSEAWLMGFDVPMERNSVNDTVPPGFSPLPQTVKRPIVGRIACGTPILAEQNIEDYADVPASLHCDFCLICQGDSMIDAGIHDGDIVYIKSQPMVETGEIAAVLIDNEATLKRVYYDGEQITLSPANPAFAPKTYSGQEIEDIHIEGKAVGYTHWF